MDGGFVHSLYVNDPDENEVELYVDVPGWDWNAPDLLGTAPRRPLPLNQKFAARSGHTDVDSTANWA